MILQYKEIDIGEEIDIHENRILKTEPLYHTKNTETTDIGEPIGMSIWYYEVDNE